MTDLTHRAALYARRTLKDRIARHLVQMGGIGVIIAILLIFFYLVYVVVPMFSSADMAESHSYALPDEANTLFLGVEEQGQISVRFTDDARVIFFTTETGETVAEKQLDLPASITSVASKTDRVFLGLADGTVLAVRYRFDVSYPDNVRTLTPALEFPLGEEPVVLDESGQALTQLSFHVSNDSAGIAVITADNRLLFARYTREESFLSDSITTELESRSETRPAGIISNIVLEPGLSHLYASGKGGVLHHYTLSEDGFDDVPVKHKFKHEIENLELLLGGTSLMVGLNNGITQQWMPVRTDQGLVLTFIREFKGHGEPVRKIAMEQRRKGFAVSDNKGQVTVYYSTSQRTLASINTANTAITHLAWSARAEHLLAIDDSRRMHVYEVHNEYPEISWDVLWGKVWYEGYDEPDYIWQSSASTNEFEPKLSLVPLSFGTIKAAIYAMIFAVPIAILGAMFTAQFMAPRMRQTVKPSIEIMEALPTVILGFLAGLWLAPYVETHLAGVFALLIVLPFGFLLCAWLWRFVPAGMRLEGWEAALLIPVILLLIWLSSVLSMPLEQLLFEGDMRGYMSNEWGMNYDQRNSLVVGLIMGFAVIPTIFSIAEDALFSVPQHLIRGSLALGATRWQTMMKVVLPAASPGIFSALMMGFGRAVGETMIVLMATGNTPLMDMSIFQGMRTLSANIAVEVPEAEVASTHYRVLFLAALVLFLFTFIFNTLAEIIRQRLRKRYSGL